MTDRRYNDDEVAAICERASKAEHANLPASAEAGGLTLAALQEIGREVGISPDAVSRAARSLDLREIFKARGAIRYDGPFRQWTNGNLQALLEPTQNGHRLRLQTVNGDSRTLMRMGTTMLVAAAAAAPIPDDTDVGGGPAPSG
jgi:hypothetical protein